MVSKIRADLGFRRRHSSDRVRGSRRDVGGNSDLPTLRSRDRRHTAQESWRRSSRERASLSPHFEATNLKSRRRSQIREK